MDAAHARTVGLVSRVFKKVDFEQRLEELVKALAIRSPAVLRLTAQQLRNRWLAGFEAALDSIEGTYLNDLMRMPDMQEGLKAAIEDRDPDWA